MTTESNSPEANPSSLAAEIPAGQNHFSLAELPENADPIEGNGAGKKTAPSNLYNSDTAAAGELEPGRAEDVRWQATQTSPAIAKRLIFQPSAVPLLLMAIAIMAVGLTLNNFWIGIAGSTVTLVISLQLIWPFFP
ncbi:MAG: hypothetical protein F6K19_17320 [Cyanothece sp. SIO1E1]|nr:hypothetical protein [Cyanothece sp. SIO1E1]